MKRRPWLPRFSLATLLLLVLLIASGGGLWWRWAPWISEAAWPTAAMVKGVHGMWPNNVAFSSDGARLVVASEDQKLRLFDLKTRSLVWVKRFDRDFFIQHQNAFNNLRFIDGDKALETWFRDEYYDWRAFFGVQDGSRVTDPERLVRLEQISPVRYPTASPAYAAYSLDGKRRTRWF